MIVPRYGGNVREYAVPISLLWTAGIFSILFVLVNLFLLADYFDTRVDKARLMKLTWQNQLLSEQFTQLQQSIEGLQIDFDVLVAKEKAIRTIFDLPEINPQARMLGVGGPRDPQLEDVTVATAAAMEVSTDVDGLLRLAQFERDRYQEVYTMLIDKRDRLDHTPSIRPAIGHFSRGFGYKDDPFTGLKQFHTGVDIANHIGTPVYATANGQVIDVEVTNGLGKTVIIDHGFGFKTKFGHLDRYKVQVGQKIKRGEIIGYMGNTGYSTGPHVHYEVLVNNSPVNPYKFIVNN